MKSEAGKSAAKVESLPLPRNGTGTPVGKFTPPATVFTMSSKKPNAVPTANIAVGQTATCPTYPAEKANRRHCASVPPTRLENVIVTD
jgi:hypothetical protein